MQMEYTMSTIAVAIAALRASHHAGRILASASEEELLHREAELTPVETPGVERIEQRGVVIARVLREANATAHTLRIPLLRAEAADIYRQRKKLAKHREALLAEIKKHEEAVAARAQEEEEEDRRAQAAEVQMLSRMPEDCFWHITQYLDTRSYVCCVRVRVCLGDVRVHSSCEPFQLSPQKLSARLSPFTSTTSLTSPCSANACCLCRSRISFPFQETLSALLLCRPS